MIKIVMMILSMMLGKGSNLGLDYGNLAQKYPAKTFSELNDIRSSNYTIVKNLLESGATFNMAGARLEVYIPNNTTRIKGSVINIAGASKAASQIVCYPFVPVHTASPNTAQNVFIEPRYGDQHTISNVTIKTLYQPLYETYSCILKFGGTTNAIKILGNVRDGFWDEMTVGKQVFYGWTFSVQGQANTISSIDEENSIIYVTTNISASVGSDTHGATVKFGTYFKVDISESDYSTFGHPWLVNNIATELITTVPAAQSGTDYVLNLNNCAFENARTHVSLSMGSMKVNVTGSVDFKYGVTPFSMFARSYAGGQKLTVDENAILSIEENGSILAGAVNLLEPSGNYGSGGYLHDSIIVKCNGTLRLINNLSASWRQYSSSYGPATGDFSFYAQIIESGSGEYAMLMSNTMPTVIDYIDARGQVLARHDTTINDGILQQLSASGVDFGVGNRSIEISNVEFLGGTISVVLFYNADFNNCIYNIPLFSVLTTLLSPASNITNISGGEIVNGGSVGPSNEGSSFTNPAVSNQMTLDGVLMPSMNFSLFRSNAAQQPYYERTRQCIVNNMDVIAGRFCVDGLSVAGTVSNVFSGINVNITGQITQHNGKGLLADLKGKSGTIQKAIIASKAYTVIGTLTNVLEVDFSHDVYETSGTIQAIIALVSNTISANPQYGNNITLRAVGGNITLKTFDASLRPTSNIIGTNDTVITEGNEIELTIDRGHIFQTGTTPTNQQIGTGNDVKTDFAGVLSQLLLDPNEVINLVAGAIDLNADSNGVFNDAAVVGYVDAYTGKYQFIFTTPPAAATPIVISFNYPNVWKNTGAWII